MRNVTIILIIIFLMLRFGYPAYQDWQLKKQVRTMLQTGHNLEMPVQFKSLPIKMEAEINYPATKFIYTLTEIDYQSMSNTQAVELTNTVKEIPCRNLYNFKKLPPVMWKPVAEVLEEDKVNLSIMVKDKNGKIIENHTQILSECRNFYEIASVA